MIRFVGGFVGLVFGLAGVLNLINTIITTILTRRHKFAAMESVGLTLGKNLVDSMWQFTFRFTLIPALAVCAVLLAVSAMVPVLALGCFHKGSITEQLRVAE